MTREPLPSKQIVADITQRIADGQLRPGDKIPSTRALASEWKVALATAAKAVTTLRDRGLVRTRPRSGSIVAPGGQQRHAPRDDLDPGRETVVDIAIAIADREGLAAVSIRTVAARLGIAPMSLYRHVDSKDELVRLMIDAAFGELTLPPRPARDWRRELETVARELWRLFRTHGWLAQVVSLTRVQALPNLFGYADAVMRALRDLDADPRGKLYIHMTLYGYVQGLAARLEFEAAASGRSSVDAATEEAMIAPILQTWREAGRFPDFTAVTTQVRDWDQDLDAIFEFGLRTLLDGFAVRYEAE